MICPICHSKLKSFPEQSECSQGHLFTMKNGVHQLMTPKYQLQLESFLTDFIDSRQSYIDQVDVTNLKTLPFTTAEPEMWKLRQFDIEQIKQYAPKKKNTTLELGAWNGWLSNRLAEMGHEVTAADIFSHSIDGLGAHIYYPNKWTSIQMDLDDLSIFDTQFDLIVVNRSISYFLNLEQTLDVLISLLSKNGVLILTGLSYSSNPQRIIEQLKNAENDFQKKYSRSFRIKDFKGYLENSDLKTMKNKGVTITKYPQLKLKSLLGHLVPSKPIYYFGLYSNKE